MDFMTFVAFGEVSFMTFVAFDEVWLGSFDLV